MAYSSQRRVHGEVAIGGGVVVKTLRRSYSLPITTFGGKTWLEVNIPSRGKAITFPQAVKPPLF